MSEKANLSYPKKRKLNETILNDNKDNKILKPFITKRNKQALLQNNNYIFYFQRTLNTGENAIYVKNTITRLNAPI